MSFQFVDNASIDSGTRTLIRSHAAKGRNLGKGRPRRKPRPTSIELHPPTRVAITRESGSNDKNDHDSILAHAPGDEFSFLAMPFELSPRSKALFRQMFSVIEIGLYPGLLKSVIDLDMSHSIWVRFTFMDEAYYHCTIAMLNVATNSLLIGDENSSQSLRHLTRTFRLINEKLSGSEATAETTFAAVVSMTQYERLRGNHKRGLVHLDGLERMTDLCGGIRQFSRTHPALTLKIFRTDLEFALALGTPTRFQYTDMPNDHITALLSTSKPIDDQLCNSAIFGHILPELQDILLMILKLTALINQYANGPSKINGNIFHETVILIGCRLLHVNPLAAPPLADNMSNMIHLSLCSFMVTFLTGLNRKLPVLPLLSGAIKAVVLKSQPISRLWHEASLWTLFIGRTTILNLTDDVWVLPKIFESVQYLGISNSEELRQCLSKFPWVNILHDNISKQLYMRISNELRTPPLFGI